MPVDILKASGAELEGNSLRSIAGYLAGRGAQAREEDHIYLVFGGQSQIDDLWCQRHSGSRPKVNGVGVTDVALLHQAVVPAYKRLAEQLGEELGDFHVLPPHALRCERDPALGYVGKKIVAICEERSQPRTAIGFVGVDANDNNMMLNVNADIIVTGLLEKYGRDVRSVLLLTGAGGVHDRKGGIVPVIRSWEIAEILKGEHQEIGADQGMRKKMEEVRLMLRIVDTVRILAARNLGRVPSEGTLCVRE